MSEKKRWLIPTLFLFIILFSVVNSIAIQKLWSKEDDSIHILTVTWGTRPYELIESGEVLKGYMWNWTTASPIRILQVEVWMGNPYNITWEGDVIVTLNNSVDLWYPPIEDAVLVHYQFDSHDSSPIPHFRSFDLRPGFIVPAGETLHIYRLFNNFDEKNVYAGDGWVVFYYI